MSLEAGCRLLMIKYCLGTLLLNTSGEMGCEAVTNGWWPLGLLGGLIPTGGSDILAPIDRTGMRSGGPGEWLTQAGELVLRGDGMTYDSRGPLEPQARPRTFSMANVRHLGVTVVQLSSWPCVSAGREAVGLHSFI